MADDGIKLTDDERDRIRAAIASGYYDHTADVKVSAAVESIVAARLEGTFFTAELVGDGDKDTLIRQLKEQAQTDTDALNRLRAELAAANARIAEHIRRGGRLVTRAEKAEVTNAALSACLERVRALADQWDKPYGEFMGHPDDVAALRAALGEDA